MGCGVRRMAILEALLLCCAAGLSALCAVSDIRRSIVPNRFLLAAIPPCVILNAIYYGLFCRDIVFEFAINCTAAALISILLYAAHIWAAGDSKLMILLAAHMPARLYFYQGRELFPIITVLILAFSVGYLFLFGQSIFFCDTKEGSLSCNH